MNFSQKKYPKTSKLDPKNKKSLSVKKNPQSTQIFWINRNLSIFNFRYFFLSFFLKFSEPHSWRQWHQSVQKQAKIKIFNRAKIIMSIFSTPLHAATRWAGALVRSFRDSSEGARELRCSISVRATTQEGRGCAARCGFARACR